MVESFNAFCFLDYSTALYFETKQARPRALCARTRVKSQELDVVDVVEHTLSPVHSRSWGSRSTKHAPTVVSTACNHVYTTVPHGHGHTPTGYRKLYGTERARSCLLVYNLVYTEVSLTSGPAYGIFNCVFYPVILKRARASQILRWRSAARASQITKS